MLFLQLIRHYHFCWAESSLQQDSCSNHSSQASGSTPLLTQQNCCPPWRPSRKAGVDMLSHMQKYSNYWGCYEQEGCFNGNTVCYLVSLWENHTRCYWVRCNYLWKSESKPFWCVWTLWVVWPLSSVLCRDWWGHRRLWSNAEELTNSGEENSSGAVSYRKEHA